MKAKIFYVIKSGFWDLICSFGQTSNRMHIREEKKMKLVTLYITNIFCNLNITNEKCLLEVIED